MPQPIVDLQEKIVAGFNGWPWSTAMQAERSYAPFTDLGTMGGIKIWVFPVAKASVVESRRTRAQELAVGITLEKKISPASLVAECDELVSLVDEIQEAMDHKSDAHIATAGFTWLGFTNEPLYLPDRLQSLQQFTSVSVFRYRVQ